LVSSWLNKKASEKGLCKNQEAISFEVASFILSSVCQCLAKSFRSKGVDSAGHVVGHNRQCHTESRTGLTLNGAESARFYGAFTA
jgi:hypothetical protein